MHVRPFAAIAVLTLPLLLWLQGCAPTTHDPLPSFEVRKSRIEQTPPSPAAPAPGIQSSEIKKDPVRIVPEETVGYDNLPTTVTLLFDAPTSQVSVLDVVTETLANNRQIKVQGYTLRIAEYEVPVSKGIYDLVTGTSLQYSRNEAQTSTAGFGSLGISRARSAGGDVTLSQLLPTGGTVDFAYSAFRNSTLIPSVDQNFNVTGTRDVTWQNVAGLGITQPLLRGFGPTVTNAAIRIAQFERRGVAADFQSGVENQLLGSLQTYWELIGAIEEYKVQVISYSLARDLLRVNQAKFGAGVVARTEVLQAEAAAEDRREQIVRARQAVRDLEDQLKRRMFLQEGTPRWNVEILPTQAISWRDLELNQDEVIATALQLRPELRRAESNLNQSEVNLQVARNNILPRVDLFGRVEANGLDRSYGESFSTLADGEFTNYAAGVQFSYPLQNRAARYRYKQAQMRQGQAGELLADTEDQIVLDVRQAVRDLRTARERIDVTQSQVRSSEASLNAERKRLDVGISTSFEVLRLQQDLANAQSQHIRAVIDYNQAYIRLERARGTLLPTYGVEVTSADLTPPIEPVLWPVGWN